MSDPDNLASRKLTSETLTSATGSQRVVIGHGVSEGESAATPSRDPWEQAKELLSGGLVVVFWLAVLAVGAFIILRNEKAQVLLNVRAADSVTVSGMVVANGSPVKNGVVHLVVYDALNDRYLTSEVVQIQSDGSFSRALLTETGRDLTGERFEVIATYTGDLQAANGDPSPVTGAASAYLNMERPLERASVAWIGGLSLFLLLMLIVLFTGELTAPKARALFAATYLMTFMSLAIPIAIAVLLTSNESLVDTMRRAPIGLVKATTENVDDEQWMLNVGGTVTAVAVPSVNAQQTDGAAGPGVSSNTRTGELSAAFAGPVRIVGGLAVPFYILMLAMLGAGINMTRQVPKVQTIYDQKITPRRESFLIATLSALFQYQAVADKNEREAAAIIRKQLIDSYMYLLAAPFLAIAVYYLLQVIADDTAEPVLVLMAFATGLISDAVVSRITDFAENTIGRLPARQATGAEAQPPSAAAGVQPPMPVPRPSGSQTAVLLPHSAPADAPESVPFAAAPTSAPRNGSGSVVSLPAGDPEAVAERVMTALVAKVENAGTNMGDLTTRPPTETK